MNILSTDMKTRMAVSLSMMSWDMVGVCIS